VTPDPVYGDELAFPEAERASAQPIDYRNGPLARIAGPSDHAGIAVVIARSKQNTRDQQAQDWMRFLQGNPEVSPLSLGCAGGGDAERAFDAYVLGPGPDGSMRYRHTHGWFNYARCRGHVLRHHETPVVPIAGGLAYAYRSRCQGCGEATGLILLNVVMPKAYGSLSSGEGKFEYWTRLVSHAALLLAPGSASSLSVRFEPEAIAVWNRVAPSPLPLRTHRLRVEATFARGDAEPTVLVAAE
jgi:hypothetical protein